MLYLILSIIFSVLLLTNFRLYPKFGISTFQAIAFNYIICFLTGLTLMPKGQSFELNFSENWTFYALFLGIGFIITFLLSGFSTQKMGMTATSLANNISLVIPVLVSLLIFKTQARTFDGLNYLGLALALGAVALSTFKKSDEKVSGKGLDFLLPVAVFLMYGITNTSINYLNINFIKSADRTVPVTLVMVLGAILAGMSILIIQVIRGKEKIEIKNILASITLGVPNFLSFYFLILALTAYGNSGAFVYPLYNIGVILVSALVAFIFFKEKLTTLNKIGLLLAILAIGLISWQDIQAIF
jgi:drug/metabolite transporter (DMT)-like permease